MRCVRAEQHGHRERIVAQATFTIAPGTTSTSTPVTLTGVEAADPSSAPISAVGSGAAIAITQLAPPPVTIKTLSCSPGTVNAPGSSACTVTLSGVAPAGGLAVSALQQQRECDGSGERDGSRDQQRRQDSRRRWRR